MTDETLLALLAGVVSAFLAWRARAWPALGWVALAPLGVAMVLCGPSASLSGVVLGALLSAPPVASPVLRSLLPLATIPSAVTWGIASWGAGSLLERYGSHWLVALLPLSALLGTLHLRLVGAPRWVSTPLACTQEPWLPVVHTARVGGELVTTALLAEAGAAVALACVGTGASRLVAAGGALLAFGGVGLGALSLQRARRRIDRAPRERVAAVVVDAPAIDAAIVESGAPMGASGDVPATVERYASQVAAAAASGACLVVLPEVAVRVRNETERQVWLDAVVGWARAHAITIVAPFFDASVPRNTLCVVEPEGVVFTYDKQHPGRGIEPPRTSRMPPGPHRSTARGWPLSTVICVDLDYGDLVAPVRRVRGVLCAPSNDWLDGFEERHHRTAVWAAVRTGTTVVRATGHGISAVFDGTGRVLARASSANGPVVLVVDAPVEAGLQGNR